MIELLLWLIAIAIAITIHEFAHALAADRLGDPTARLSDRLSLNPLKHYDTVGTTLLIFSAVLSSFGGGGFIFGWAKPVPYDPYNLENPKRGALLIALAGPAINIIFAILLYFLATLVLSISPETIRFALYNSNHFIEAFTTGQISAVSYIGIRSLVVLISINISLAIFNLLPIQPLDGSKILYGLLPQDWADEYEDFMRMYGTSILMISILPLFNGRSLVSTIVSPAIIFVLKLLLG
jgi:Zn-dependent protease